MSEIIEGKISTGIAKLDSVLDGGLKNGELVCVAARPGMGKTAFVLGLAANAAEKGAVYFFSDDARAEDVVSILLSILGRIDTIKLRKDELTPSESEKLENAMDALCKKKLYICDSTDGMEELISSSDMPALIVADSIVRAGDDEYTKALRHLAKKFDSPVIFTSALPRSIERRKDKRPCRKDLSAAAIREGERAILLYRDNYYTSDSPDELAEVIVEGDGRRDTVNVRWIGKYCLFCDLENE